MKKFVSGLIFILALSQPSNIVNASTSSDVRISAAMNDVNIFVNGTSVKTPNFVYNGVTFVPLREISTLLNKSVTWDAATGTTYISDKPAESQNRTSTSASPAIDGIMDINVKFDRIKIVVNGKYINDSNILYNGVTYVPLRAIGTMLNKEISWNERTKTVSINDTAVSVTSQQFQQMHNIGKSVHDFISEVSQSYSNLIRTFDSGKISVSRDSWSNSGGRINIGGYDFSNLNAYRAEPPAAEVFIFTPTTLNDWRGHTTALNTKYSELLNQINRLENQVPSNYLSALKSALASARFEYTPEDFTNITYNATLNNMGNTPNNSTKRLDIALNNLHSAVRQYTESVQQFENSRPAGESLQLPNASLIIIPK